MLPGVMLPEGGIPALGEFKKGDTRAIIIHGTKYCTDSERMTLTL